MRTPTAAAELVSRELRLGTDPRIRARRRSAACSLTGAGILGFLSLYQLGLLRHLPDPPLPWLDSDLVDGSGEAYWVLSAADAPLGVCTFAVTAALAGAGGADRAGERPWIVVAWGAKAAADAAYGLVLAVEQPTHFKRLCGYCLVVTGCALAAVPPAVPEVRAALLTLRDQRRSWRSASRASGTADGKAAA